MTWIGRVVCIRGCVLVGAVLVGAVVIARKGVAEGRRTAVAFGPLLALGGVAAVLVGDALVDAYVAAL